MRRLLRRTVHAVAYHQMQVWARRLIRHHRPIIVGITGSVGKTTTKEMVAAVLMHPDARPYVGTVGKSERSLNNNSGLPLSVLRVTKHPANLTDWAAWIVRAPLQAGRQMLAPYPDVLVLEYGLGAKGDIAVLAEIAPPTVAVVTAVGPAHLDTLGTIARVAQGKARLIRDVPPTGLVVLGSHNAYTAAMATQTRAPVVYAPGRGRELAEHVARAIGRYFDVPDEIIDRAIEAGGAVPGRQDAAPVTLPGIGEIVLIDDSFNANPLSMELGLDLLAGHAAPGRRVAVLGAMLELGAESERYHADIGAHARARADLLIGVGEAARRYEPHHWYATSAACADPLPSHLAHGDVVLVKGSRATAMKQVVGALRASGSVPPDPAR